MHNFQERGRERARDKNRERPGPSENQATHYTVARKLLDFDFLRGIAPGRLDGFSIERSEKNRGSFELYAAKFESGAMRFLGEKSPRRWNPFKTSFHPCLSIQGLNNR